DAAVRVYVRAEIASIDNLSETALGLRDVGRVHRTVAIDVTSQDPHWDVDIHCRLIAGAIDPIDSDIDHLRVGYVCQRNGNDRTADRHVTRAHAGGADASRARCHLCLWAAGDCYIA